MFLAYLRIPDDAVAVYWFAGWQTLGERNPRLIRTLADISPRIVLHAMIPAQPLDEAGCQELRDWWLYKDISDHQIEFIRIS
jgi:hypothetical protein